MAIFGSSTQARRDSIARFFAPVIYQEVNNSERDFLSRATFDGDWQGNNNWSQSLSWPKAAYVYVSLVEDANRLFIHYGTFHPADWCQGPGPWGICALGEDEHENDMEGMKLVVDKRFTTAAYPFGQILTMETVFHNDIFAYRNCSLQGGHPLYVTPSYNEYGVFRGGMWDGCILFSTNFNFSTVPAPPNRSTLKIEPQGHGNSALYSEAAPFQSHGITYWPSNTIAETPSTTTANEDIAYRLQWMDKGEPTTSSYSLWTQRLNNGTQAPTKIFRTDDNTQIGPHDVHYLSRFVCENHCPNFSGGNALAPWGIVTNSMISEGEHRGDWHNHPAWVWAHHYMVLSAYAGSGYYDYACLEEACRTGYFYEYNPYWADSYWTLPYTPATGTPPCQTPPCPLTLRSAASGERFPIEQRWDFESLDGTAVTGTGVGAVEVVRIDDPDWGYKQGASILRITGRGQVRVSLQANSIETAKNDFLLVRLRRGSTRLSNLRVAWGGARQSAVRDDQEADSELIRESGGWEIRQLPLSNHGSWRQLGLARRMDLWFDLGSGPAEVLELDFVLVGR